jgi:hypothetical protein
MRQNQSKSCTLTGAVSLSHLMADFSEYIVAKWSGDFNHRFPIPPHRAWRDWRRHPAIDSNNHWFCASLREASERYSWQSGEPSEFVLELQKSLQANDERGAIEACKHVFRWGGVAQRANDRSRQWIHDQGKELPQTIRRAVNFLKDPNGDLDRFNGVEFLMNSAMTKIYWAADESRQIVIYDGRVGAALGLLAREFVQAKGFSRVPEELKFLWGASRDPYITGVQNKRNPSEASLVFPPLFSPARNDFRHAVMVRRTSHLLQRVAEMLGANGSVLGLEKALFMVGYDVRHGSNA